MQVDIFEDMNTGRTLPEREINTGKRNGRARLEVIRHETSFSAASLIWEEPRPGPAPCTLAAARVVLPIRARWCREGGGQAGSCRRSWGFADGRLWPASR